jgi:hypothetical protein
MEGLLRRRGRPLSRPRSASPLCRCRSRLRDIAATSKLPGQALAVFLAVHHRQTLTRNLVVTLSKRMLAAGFVRLAELEAACLGRNIWKCTPAALIAT